MKRVGVNIQQIAYRVAKASRPPRASISMI